MANRINAGRALMQKLVNGRVISPSGADWAIIAADPFHDDVLPNLCGYPQEGVNGQSVVLKVPYQMTITSPTALPDGQTWQFMLTSYPWLDGIGGSPTSLVPYRAYGNHLTNTGATSPTSNIASSISIYKGPDGTDLGPFNVGLTGNDPVVQGMSLEAPYTKGPHRLISWGIEVYDTTAVIDRQGTCTVWRQNTNTVDKTSWMKATATIPGPANRIGVMAGVIIRRPPRNISEANKLAGTKSWKSEDGCYLVCTMNSNDICIKQADDTQPVLYLTDVQAEPRVAGTFSEVLSGPEIINNAGTGTDSIISPQMLWDFQPYNMSGCFFTGLKKGATFLVRTVFYVERFPTPDEPDIVLVTKPSATYDPMALEIYDQMLHRMPPGVPVADNGLGEWFFDGVNAAVSWLGQKLPSFSQLPIFKFPSSPPKKAIKPNSTAPVTTTKSVPKTKPLQPRNSSPANKPKETITKEMRKLLIEKEKSGQTLSQKEKRMLGRS